MKRLTVLIALLLVSTTPRAADAFCGFYVDGAGSDLFNNATQVVLMREGTRTVLSMQNNYQGPPSDFAMVVPVPVVLQEEHVKTLPHTIFDRVDKLAAPRLVEYWEQDPCAKPMPEKVRMTRARRGSGMKKDAKKPAEDLGVTVEAQFEVGEYQIVILSAKESTGLETWLKQEGYKIPEGAATYLEPYVESGSKFFVAKVDIEKVTMKDGMAQLSPLRFHYDSEQFALPIRLGLMNAKDKQDLIVHILARGKRYELANYPNAFIPTNLDLKDDTKKRFGEFYAALFDATLEKNKGAVITEYSWDASSCDPCPTPALNHSELMTLGLDVLSTAGDKAGKPTTGRSGRMRRRMPRRRFGGYVLTRLHARYGPGDVKDDLVFKEAPAVVGGREIRSGRLGGTLEEGAQPSSINNFQARYAIRHVWTGPIECLNPVRGRWGGPPSGTDRPPIEPATDLAFAPRGKLKLAAAVAQDVPELGVVAAAGGPGKPTPPEPAKADDPPAEPKKDEKKEKKGCSAGGDAAPWLLLIALFALARRRESVR